MIEIKWSKIKNPESRDSRLHCEGGINPIEYGVNSWKEWIFQSYNFERLCQNMNYYGVKSSSDIFFWKERPELVEEI